MPRDIVTKWKLQDSFTNVVKGIDTSLDGFSGKAEKSLARVAQSFLKVRTAVTGAVAAFGLERLVTQTAAADVELVKISRRLAFTVEELSILRFAAGQTGTSLDAITEGLRDAQQRLEDFAVTGGGEARDLFGLIPELEEAARSGSKFADIIDGLRRREPPY